jgi:hypothetical protein
VELCKRQLLFNWTRTAGKYPSGAFFICDGICQKNFAGLPALPGMPNAPGGAAVDFR